MDDWNPSGPDVYRVTGHDPEKHSATLAVDAAKLTAALQSLGHEAEAVVHDGAIYLRGSYARELRLSRTRLGR